MSEAVNYRWSVPPTKLRLPTSLISLSFRHAMEVHTLFQDKVTNFLLSTLSV
ncbi:hypothetical protein MTR_8g024090 [Medicago truncatula]|uniref:Uncharacterized protein n=1 Tax=Medicago truncatula TaxID=3880 RepID=A0A072TMW4_MEDTR|nr:hypothetical protein MTR_8g024090 [Medicago truncatula]